MENDAVDLHLRQLIGRTMNLVYADTPSLDYQLRTCLQEVERGADDPDFPNIGTDERDYTIKKLLRECLYDA